MTESTVGNHVDVPVFLPLGVLSKETRNYSLGTEFLHDVENSGISNIKLNAVFFRIPPELTNFREEAQEIQLFNEVQNPYEDQNLNLYCKHYISASFDLASPLQPFDYGTDFPNTYIMDKGTRLLIQEMANRTGRAGRPMDSRKRRLGQGSVPPTHPPVGYRWGSGSGEGPPATSAVSSPP